MPQIPMSEATLGSRYRLDAAIGRGGMATVWRATDLKLDRPVAIKRLHSARIDDAEFTARFKREAQLVGRLSHPNVVRLLDGGEDEEGPYLVLELVEGETLKDRIQRDGALAPAEAARIVAQVADALAYAHAEGIVHRDVKSQNVLIARDGVARLADFGIARMVDSETQAGLTSADVMLGSADYLAPEQAQSGKLDGRADVYSLGVVLYECLTGELPFRGDGFVAVAMQHVSQEVPDPKALEPACPAFLSAAVRRSCAKEPQERFASASQMAAALREEGGNTAQMPAITPGSDTGTTSEVRRRRGLGRPVAAGLAVALAVGAAAGVGLYALEQRDSGGGPVEEASVEPLALAGIADFDPEGDGGERPVDVPNAADGDPESVWYTERYETADFGNLKDGVGLLLSAADGARIDEIALDSPTAGASFEVLGGAGATGERPVLASGATAGGEQTVPLEGVDAGNEVVLWFTALTEDEEGKFWAGVGQVELRGASNSSE